LSVLKFAATVKPRQTTRLTFISAATIPDSRGTGRRRGLLSGTRTAVYYAMMRMRLRSVGRQLPQLT